MTSGCHEESKVPLAGAPDRRAAAAAPACHHAQAAAPPCHTGEAADSCCETPARTDWFLWSCVILVAATWLAGALGPAHDHATFFGIFTSGVYELLGKIWWGLALGVVFVGLLARIPRDLVMAVLGRDGGFNGLLRATLAGVFLDLCSHGILAVGMKLYERGASIGQVMAFLLASPWNSLSLTLILIGLIGLGWTLMFILLSLVVGIVSGAIFNRLVRGGRLSDNPWRATLGDPQPIGVLFAEFRSTVRLSWGGVGDVLRDGLSGSRVVIRWALFGLLLAALIRALVPADDFSTWFGASFAGLWLTLLAATIIEVCSEGATPIAADLMNRAAAPGNSFTFLMAGVATDYTELMSIRDTTSSWKIALFLPLVTVPQVMVLGFILNQF
jgi:uncharacterized membrane protein YraQ (UPF0718 family)